MNTPKRFIRKSLLAGMQILAILVVAAFTQNLFAGTAADVSSIQLGADSTLRAKLQASLASLTSAMLPAGNTVDVIVQFNNDLTRTDTRQVRARKTQARRQVITSLGGTVYQDYDNLPFHACRLGFKLPSTREYKEFTSNLPPELERILKEIG